MRNQKGEPHKRHFLRWIGLGLGAVFICTLLAMLWIFNTASGTRWLAGIAVNASGGQLTITAVDGKLARTLTLQGLHWGDRNSAIEIAANRIDIDIDYASLLRKIARVETAQLSGLRVMLHQSSKAKPENEPSQPFSLRAPIDVELLTLTVRDAELWNRDQSVLIVQRLSASGSWHGSNLELRKLDVSSPQGSIQLTAAVTQHNTYSGHAHGQFSWKVADQSYVGKLLLGAEHDNATVDLHLTQPLSTRLQIGLVQKDNVPWHATLDVPRSDPRGILVADSSPWQYIEMHLSGNGTLQNAVLTGQAHLNDSVIDLERLMLSHHNNDIRVEALDLLLNSRGSLHASGHFALTDVPEGAVQASWRDFSLPPEWLGQPLQTRGDLSVAGSARAYSGGLRAKFGPANKLADITADFNGSAETLHLEILRVKQAAGLLQARGTLRTKPWLEWDSTIDASNFDPGEFAAAWRGNLSLSLKTSGSIQAEGVNASLNLERLSGRLRGHALSGAGALKLSPDARFSGSLSLRSESSFINIRAKEGARLNADLEAEIKALSDWLPGSQGSMHANLDATGRWPAIALNGEVRANGLRLTTLAADHVLINLKAENPKSPSGTVDIGIGNVAAPGVELSSMSAHLSGNMQEHALDVDAVGKPLGAHLRLTGAYKQDAWTGTLHELTLNVADHRKFALEAPLHAELSPTHVEISQSCLRSEDSRLCGGFQRVTGKSMKAMYRLQRMPLSLINALAPNLPVSVAGELAGEGAIEQTTGSWYGHAEITSSSGKVARVNKTSRTTQSLLTYDDLQLRANLDGTRAHATVHTRLNRSADVNGSLGVSDIDGPEPQLDGHLEAVLPNLDVVAAFTPQLANVAGEARLSANIRGNTRAPKFPGRFQATKLAADLPALGMKLSSGNIEANADENGAVALAGSVVSGRGTLNLKGRFADGELSLRADGDHFLVADIPSARVIVTPDINVHYADNEFHVEGTVDVPNAAVDVQKLPRGAKPARASADIVVTDEPQSEEKKPLPVFAKVTVSLGDDVKVAGYGLDATVKGQLTVREQPGDETRAAGQLRVAGTYRAYGQDLTIEHGNVLYADVPIDNPGLDIAAVRKVEDVTAGVRIAGTAQNPRLSVYSDPEMGEANALSYLVAGKPLDAIGTSEGDGSALQSAARSLGTAGGGLLAKKLGKRLGVDQVGIEKNELTGGSAFTIGQYLSPRLFLSYGVGLFEAGDIVTLRYRLAKSLVLQAQRGSEETRTGVEYRIEK